MAFHTEAQGGRLAGPKGDQRGIQVAVFPLEIFGLKPGTRNLLYKKKKTGNTPQETSTMTSNLNPKEKQENFSKTTIQIQRVPFLI